MDFMKGEIMLDELTDAIIALIDARKAYKDAMADCDGT